MKPLLQSVVFYALQAGIFIGSFACLAVGSYLLWKKKHKDAKWRLAIAAFGAVCGWACYASLCAASLYERRYGFNFNDPTIRMEFVRWGSSLATFGILGALFTKGSARTALLFGCLLINMYWFLIVEAI